jgi:hypothetical protein
MEKMMESILNGLISIMFFCAGISIGSELLEWTKWRKK